MNVSNRIELLHDVADVIRIGGDIDINQYGELELRTAGFAERMFRRFSNMPGVGVQNSFKISEGAVPQISFLVSEVAEELRSASSSELRDCAEVKAQLAYIYFGKSRTLPWIVLLLGASPSSSITLTSFAQSHHMLVQQFDDIETQSRLDEVDSHLHHCSAKLFIELVQQAIEAGEAGRYNVEYIPT